MAAELEPRARRKRRSFSGANQCRAAVTPITSLGHNVDAGTDCGFDQPTDLSGTDPLPGSRDEGGASPVHPLLPRSPAIDSADDVGCPPDDQLGHARPFDGDGDEVAVCDRGAVEFLPEPTRALLALAAWLALGSRAARALRRSQFWTVTPMTSR